MNVLRGLRVNSSNVRVFIMAVGDFGNIGDALIRRNAISWFRGLGPLNVYTGDGGAEWGRQLELSNDDVVYSKRRLLDWLVAVCLVPRRKVVVLDPGEVRLGSGAWKLEGALFAVTLLARITGARVIRSPRAVRAEVVRRVPLKLHRLACRISSVSLWRDLESARLVGVGRAIPDIGFWRGGTGGPSEEQSVRKSLVVSLRGDRPTPLDQWVNGVASFARRRDLEVCVISQVRSDETRSRELAQRLGGVHIEWAADNVRQEQICKEVYSRSVIALSDRLHVLVLAAIAGARPLELVDGPTGKIPRHFRMVTASTVSRSSFGLDAPEIEGLLEERMAIEGPSDSELNSASAALESMRSEVLRALDVDWTDGGGEL